MAKFTFRLETLLKLRMAERDQRRIALAETLTLVERVVRRIDALDKELRAVAKAQAVRPGVVDVDRLMSADRYAVALRQDRAECEQEQLALEAEVAARRAALVAADQEARALEKLREKQHAQFEAEAERRQQRELDEIAARATINEAPA
jgi:flagellar FliJ protein